MKLSLIKNIRIINIKIGIYTLYQTQKQINSH